jgi:hypothetical protein
MPVVKKDSFISVLESRFLEAQEIHGLIRGTEQSQLPDIILVGNKWDKKARAVTRAEGEQMAIEWKCLRYHENQYMNEQSA